MVAVTVEMLTVQVIAILTYLIQVWIILADATAALAMGTEANNAKSVA